MQDVHLSEELFYKTVSQLIEQQYKSNQCSCADYHALSRQLQEMRIVNQLILTKIKEIEDKIYEPV